MKKPGTPPSRLERVGLEVQNAEFQLTEDGHEFYPGVFISYECIFDALYAAIKDAFRHLQVIKDIVMATVASIHEQGVLRFAEAEGDPSKTLKNDFLFDLIGSHALKILEKDPRVPETVRQAIERSLPKSRAFTTPQDIVRYFASVKLAIWRREKRGQTPIAETLLTQEASKLATIKLAYVLEILAGEKIRIHAKSA